MGKNILEVCAGDIASVTAAAEGGASRIELCQGLTVGGLTPSVGLMQEARKVAGLKMHVLVRPREGDFVYNETETAAMTADIQAARDCGADGVVIGALMPDGSIDVKTCRRLISAANGMSITFHRAFDLARDPFDALEAIIDLGCDRILTSGQAANALEGAEMLRKLQETASSRLTILAGCGVTAGNAAEIIRRSGCREVHASARRLLQPVMTYRHEGVAMGTPGYDEYSRKSTHPDEVRAIVDSINSL